MGWQRNDKTDKVYYTIGSGKKEVYSIRHVSAIDLKALEKELTEDDIIISSDGDKIPEHLITYKTEDIEAGDELPSGAYRFINGSYPSNDRLEIKGAPRKEAHIKLHNTESILKDMQHFLNNKQAYADMGISHRRGYLIHGPPGNGKTELIRNLLTTHFQEAVTIWCDTLPPNYFLEELNAIPKLKILVLEELTNRDGGTNYHMNTLLSILDGESSLSNCIVIATTNYPELLAENLADRPSRFDMVVEVKNPGDNDVKALFELFLKRSLAEGEIEVKGMSVAHIKEIAILHKIYGISLKEAYDKMLAQSKSFKQNFQEKKQFGI